MSILCKIVWWLSEEMDIPLGRFAPYVFGKMIKAKEMTEVD